MREGWSDEQRREAIREQLKLQGFHPAPLDASAGADAVPPPAEEALESTPATEVAVGLGLSGGSSSSDTGVPGTYTDEESGALDAPCEVPEVVPPAAEAPEVVPPAAEAPANASDI